MIRNSNEKLPKISIEKFFLYKWYSAYYYEFALLDNIKKARSLKALENDAKKHFYIEFILDARFNGPYDDETLGQIIKRLEVFENGEVIEGGLVDKVEVESQKSL